MFAHIALYREAATDFSKINPTDMIDLYQAYVDLNSLPLILNIANSLQICFLSVSERNLNQEIYEGLRMAMHST